MTVVASNDPVVVRATHVYRWREGGWPGSKGQRQAASARRRFETAIAAETADDPFRHILVACRALMDAIDPYRRWMETYSGLEDIP